MEGCVSGTEQRNRKERLAAKRDVPITSSEEEFVSDMVQHRKERLAVTKDVPICHRKGEFV